MRCILVILALTVSAVFGQNNRSAVSLSGNDMATCTVPDPCRTFDVAISKTNSGGEVVVLSTAGYGAFTVTKSVSIISPSAIHAALAPTTGIAIIVNAPGATVILRNLYLNSLGASTGVSIWTNTIIHIEGLVVNGFSQDGIDLESQGGTAELFLKDSEIRGNAGAGVFLRPISGNAVATIDHVRLERNLYGLLVESGVDVSVRNSLAVQNTLTNFNFENLGAMLAPLRATVERSIASDSQSYGFAAAEGARVTVRDSAAVRSYDGFISFGANATTEMVLDRCLAAENNHGIAADSSGVGQGVMTVSNSTVVRNVTNGIYARTNGTVRVFGNTVTKNGTGMNASGGTIRSGGHNFVDGNTVETFGTITPVPTM
jgi:hypothetical protein